MVCPRRGQPRHLQGQFFGQPQIIAVLKRHPIRPGRRHPGIAGRTGALIGLLHHNADPVIPQRPGNAQTVIARGIINQDQLEIPEGLRQHAVDGLAQR